MSHLRRNAVAYLALFVALGGTGYAAIRLPAGSVGTRQLRNGAVTDKKVKAHSLTANALAPGVLSGQPRTPSATPSLHTQVITVSVAEASAAGGLSVPCPSGTQIVGGGYDVSGADNATVLASYPSAHGVGDDTRPAWTVTWNVSTTGTRPLDVYADCAWMG